MNELKLSENLVRLRREKNVTQEALAAFVGVTKGAVSKWGKWHDAAGCGDAAALGVVL